MAVPKRKTSISKKMRRSHHKLSSNIIEDKKSGEYKLSIILILSRVFITVRKS